MHIQHKIKNQLEPFLANSIDYTKDLPWAIRNTDTGYLAYTQNYAKMLSAGKKTDLGEGINALAVDEATLDDIIYKDCLVIQAKTPLSTIELFLINTQLIAADIARQPISNDEEIIAIKVVIAPVSSSSNQLIDYRNQESPEIKNYLNILKLRDWEIGLFMLFGWNTGMIAEYYSISVGRINYIVNRLCRKLINENAGCRRYRQFLVESGLYKYIPRELIIKHLELFAPIDGF